MDRRAAGTTRARSDREARGRATEVRTMEPISRTPETATSNDHASECRWWSARRAAAYVGADPKDIYKAVRAGKLKAVRLNQRGDIRTTREWVTAMLETCCRPGEILSLQWQDVD